ncbi:hypothetical protein LMH73_019030 [Vibrio splendidus]|nr:hypothetical protein [Vibrio splendidus]MCC4883316.1 hypothetical protein [Vibrio splendidus]
MLNIKNVFVSKLAEIKSGELSVNWVKSKVQRLLTSLKRSRSNRSEGIFYIGSNEKPEVWFTRDEVEDHIQEFGGYIGMRRGKTAFNGLMEEELKSRVNVEPHKHGIHALCITQSAKSLWLMTLSALTQSSNASVTVGDIQQHINLAGLIALSQNQDVLLETQHQIHQYLTSLPSFIEGIDANELPQATYEMHGKIAMDVWSAITEQIVM